MNAIGLTARPAAPWGPVSDHRWLADPELGLYVVADASGPTYGGYYAPYGIDPGLEALVASFRRHRGPDGLRRAMMAANEVMTEIGSSLAAAHAARRETEDLLSASLLASADLRPARFAALTGVHAHAAGSLVALAIGPDGDAVAGVGDCRVYRRRAGALEVVQRDHTRHGVCLRLLGLGPVEIEGSPLVAEPHDAYLLCTRGVWSADPAVLARVPLRDGPLQAFAGARAEEARIDATLVACGDVERADRASGR